MANHLYETHFEDYIKEKRSFDLHPKQSYISMPEVPNTHMIFYGPPGVGKYSTSLMYINKYSISNLSYEKKLNVSYNKETRVYKISDIHFEVDMDTLGCNARLLWSEIMSQIEDVISSRQNKSAIILCKNFHKIHNELLEIFYSFMQRSNVEKKIFFYIISESISFIPDNIMNCCLKLRIPRPSNIQYSKCLNVKIKNASEINNIKEIKMNGVHVSNKYTLMCSVIYKHITNPEQLKYTKFRDVLYDILIYNYDLCKVIFTLLTMLIDNGLLSNTQYSSALTYVYTFLKSYNNNYRPIYHLELLMFNLISVIHGL